MDISSMIEAGGHVKFEVGGEDLRHFAEQLIEKAAQLVARPTEPPKEKWLTQKEACSSAVSARPLSGNGAAEVTSSPPNSATATCICSLPSSASSTAAKANEDKNPSDECQQDILRRFFIRNVRLQALRPLNPI